MKLEACPLARAPPGALARAAGRHFEGPDGDAAARGVPRSRCDGHGLARCNPDSGKIHVRGRRSTTRSRGDVPGQGVKRVDGAKRREYGGGGTFKVSLDSTLFGVAPATMA